MLKQTACAILLLGVFVMSAFGNPCDTHSSGDWCFNGGYVSCPNPGVRPCQPGLVCQQTDLPAGVVYCVRPTEVQGVSVTIADQSSSSSAAAASGSTSGASNPVSVSASLSGVVSGLAGAVSGVVGAVSGSGSSSSASASSSHTASTSTVATATTGTATSSSSGGSGSWPNGPVKAIYIDNFCWDPTFSFNTLIDSGYNLIILAFYVNMVQFDCAIAWYQLGAAGQQATIQYAHSKNARIIVSTGGSTDSPYAQTSAANYASVVANFAKNNYLDGVDFDLENFGRDFTFGSMSTSETVQWVADATNEARSILGSSAIITHAPQPPYFGNYGWADGYGKIYDLCPTINFFLVQFYNNGPTTTYDSIFVSNGVGASVSEMAAQGIPLSKIVVGKPVHANDIGDVTQGYNTGAQLNSIFAQAKAEMGWNTGVMGWQWTDVATNTAWIKAIYP